MAMATPYYYSPVTLPFPISEQDGVLLGRGPNGVDTRNLAGALCRIEHVEYQQNLGLER
jgi:hypothetical protein